ncbi:MAG: hypothetical protein AB1Z23_02890 [Eubacteriales bacterium]
MRFKKLKIVAISLLAITICAVLTGCIGIAKNAEFSNLKTATYKHDIYNSSGQLAAFYNNRVYFASGQGDSYGIYSMNLDGKDFNFEIATRKIIKIIIADDGIYYIELSYLGKSKDERYSLYKYDRENNESVLLSGEGERESAVNAVIFSEDEIFIRQIKMIGTSRGAESYIEMISNISKTPIKSVELFNINESYYYGIIVYDKYIITFAENVYFDPNETSELDFDYNDALYFIDTGESLLWQTRENANCDLKVINTNEEYIFLAYLNELIALDRETLLESYRIKLDITESSEKIDYMFEYEGLQYLITSTESNKHNLYARDTQNSEFNKIMYFDEKVVLINIVDNCIIYAVNNEVYCQEAKADGLGEIEYTIKFEGNIVDNNIFEIAGNWLFIYDRGKPREIAPLELLYKVNLDTKEIID